MVVNRKCTCWRVVVDHGCVSVWNFNPSMDYRGGWVASSHVLLRGRGQRILGGKKSKRDLVRHTCCNHDLAKSLGSHKVA